MCQIRRKLGIWSRLLKKSLMGNFISCSALDLQKDLIEVFNYFVN